MRLDLAAAEGRRDADGALTAALASPFAASALSPSPPAPIRFLSIPDLPPRASRHLPSLSA